MKHVDELFDGVILCEVFAQMYSDPPFCLDLKANPLSVNSFRAPRHGDMSTLKRSVAGNWLLKKANIKLLLDNIDEFYRDELFIASDTRDINIGNM